jgi:hypothetical protein
MGTAYSTISVSGYNANPPPDDGSQSAANQINWSTIKGKLPDPLKTAIEAINTALVTAFDFSVNQKTANYTTVAGDHMRTVEVAPSVSSAVTISLGDASTMTSKYMVRVRNSGTGVVTVGRATGGDTIDGAAANKTLASGQAVWFGVTPSANGYISLSAVNYSPGDHTVAGALTVTGRINADGSILLPNGVAVQARTNGGVATDGLILASTDTWDLGGGLVVESTGRFDATGGVLLANTVGLRSRDFSGSAVDGLKLNASDVWELGGGSTVKVAALAGSGTRAVVVDANGVLSAP